MAFDPSSIKKKRRVLAPENLPEGASREERILALANVLHERGLTSSLGAAKRLAEGMVDTERKVLSDGMVRRDDRGSFQRADSPLFTAVGGRPRLRLSDAFRAFVERAAPLTSSGKHALHARQSLSVREREVEVRPQVFHADSPVDHWKIPQKKADQGYEKTQVEASREGVVVRHVEATATTDTQVEEGIIVDDGRVDGGSGESAGSGESGERTGPESKIDLFDVFNTGKSDE